MKVLKTTAIAMMALAGLASCSKDDNGRSGSGEQQSIRIYIGQPTANGTRSIDSPEATNTDPVVFSNGDLFLCDASGTIQYIYTFSSAATGGNNLNIGEATGANGVTISNIKGSVTDAYLVGNSSAITGTAYSNAKTVGGNITAVKAVALSPQMQYNSSNKDLSAVTLYGEGTTGSDPLGGADDKLVEITLRPQVARLELSDITAVPSAAPVVTITDYNVDGIYISNFYQTMTLAYTPGTLFNPGQGGASVYGDGIAPYTTPGVVHDYDASYFGNAVTAAVKYPNGTDNTEVWAYNLFASPTASTTVAPQIIVAVKDVVADNAQDYSGRKFITANKLYESDGITEITHFQAGRIYQILPGDFEFSVKNLHTEGSIGQINLRVKVSMIQWTTESMKPGLQE